tara:strand:+ start:825 stop:1079 length:255 start_codon:yes stop_codon:yes gene_type:complete
MKYIVEVERVEQVVFREFVTIEADTKWKAQEAIQDHWVGPDVTYHLPELEQEHGFKVVECSTPEEIDATIEEVTVHHAGIADKQ